MVVGALGLARSGEGRRSGDTSASDSLTGARAGVRGQAAGRTSGGTSALPLTARSLGPAGMVDVDAGRTVRADECARGERVRTRWRPVAAALASELRSAALAKDTARRMAFSSKTVGVDALSRAKGWRTMGLENTAEQERRIARVEGYCEKGFPRPGGGQFRLQASRANAPI